MKDEKYDYLEYWDSLNPDEKKLVRDFYEAYYTSKVNESSLFDNHPEIKSEAIRNKNLRGRDDLIYRARREGVLSNLDDVTTGFMKDASDDWDWEAEYKKNGFEAAVKMILQQTIEDLENNNIEKEITLLRYYEKRDRLRRILARDARKNGKKSK